MLRTALAFCLGVVFVSLVGCGSGEAKLVNDLKQTGLAFHNYHDAHQQGPPGWDELIAFDKAGGGDGSSIERARDAGYQMKWDVKLSEITAGTSNTVLAENPAGGPKLMMDGSVRLP